MYIYTKIMQIRIHKYMRGYYAYVDKKNHMIKMTILAGDLELTTFNFSSRFCLIDVIIS
jgi:hypothetical protein